VTARMVGQLSAISLERCPRSRGIRNRPTDEVLFPNEKPLADVFRAEFEGMTMEAVELDDLLSTRRRMLEELPRQLLPRHCDFLLSMVRAEPDWSLLPYAHLRRLPALQWKLSNLTRLKRNAPKFQFQYDELTSRLATAGLISS